MAKTRYPKKGERRTGVSYDKGKSYRKTKGASASWLADTFGGMTGGAAKALKKKKQSKY